MTQRRKPNLVAAAVLRMLDARRQLPPADPSAAERAAARERRRLERARPLTERVLEVMEPGRVYRKDELQVLVHAQRAAVWDAVDALHAAGRVRRLARNSWVRGGEA